VSPMPILLGGNPNPNGFDNVSEFNIIESAVYDRALTESDIIASGSDANSLINKNPNNELFYYKFNDYQNTDNYGTLYGNPTRYNDYINLDGVDDYVNAGYANYNFKSGQTYILKVKITTINKNLVLMGNWENAGGGLYYISSTKILLYEFYNVITDKYEQLEIVPPTPIEINQIYTIVATYDNMTLKLFLNGVKVGGRNIGGNIKVSPLPILLGGNPDWRPPNVVPEFPSEFNIIESAVYDRALTESDIIASGSDVNSLINKNPSNQLFYYKFKNNQNIDKNKIIPIDYIKAMYVWIPRYSYKLWNVNNEGKPEQEIDIKFVHRDVIENGSTNGTYLTHPAFWWDNNSNGIRENNEELKGIWVGKFETTGDANTPTIKPNLTSLRNQNVSTQFITAQKFKKYGLNNINTDAHMMKNMEWGAVAYLSHSKYGLNNEIRNNNSSTYITGCTGDSQYVEFAGCQKAYNTSIGYLASTTGNITGIYDMVGGSVDNVMGNMKDINGNFYSLNSGFANAPLGKYYDKYSNGDLLDHSRGLIGDATRETLKTFGNVRGGWYGDFSEMTSTTYSWIARGGQYSHGVDNGVFQFSAFDGHSDIKNSFRSVIIK
ncbi:MAG: LamG-like jellyroll fold domain-containing protein, partial [Bacilli bacterium]